MKTRIVITGGGIIGAACAYELARRGSEVTLVDKGEIGHGCSYGNAGWVTPCFALPLPMPGMWLKSVRWLLDRDSPLYIKPRASWELIRWLSRFACSMNERRMRRSATVRALVQAAVRHGATILPGTEVFDFECRGSRIESVRTTRGNLRADQFVLATGSWSARLARLLELRVPVLSGKGYFITVERFDPCPAIPLMLVERKVAVTPRKDSVRLAGTLELVDLDETITTQRVEAILRGAEQVVNLPQNPKIIETWRGLRPCSPDGVPVIGRSPNHENLIIATGHQMLGLLTAAATGRLAADILLGADPCFDPEAFSPARF